MFFIASKIFWMLASPINLLLFGALAGVLLCNGRRARFGRVLAFAAILVLLAAATLSVGTLLIGPLENRFPQPPADMRPPYGIIVLGGAIDDIASPRPDDIRRGRRANHGGRHPRQALPRGAHRLHRGNGFFGPGASSTEALRARELMTQMGVAPERITIEDKSRNTDENARFTAAIVHPEPSQRWVIVTSAFHMPRATGVFEKAGFHPIAYSVAFYTFGRWPGDLRLNDWPARNLRIIELALHEWIGLAAYWTSGRIDHLFPGPGNAA